MATKKELSIQFKAITGEFSKNVKGIDDDVKMLNKEFKLQQEQMRNTATEAEKLKAKHSNLNQQYDLARSKTEETNKAYQKTVDLLGENSKEAQTWKSRLLDAQRNEEYLKNALDDTNKALFDQEVATYKATNSIQDVGLALTDASGRMKDVGSTLTTNVTGPLMGLANQAMEAWAEYDDAMDGIVTATGASGDALDDMESTYRKVFSELPVESKKVGSAIGELNTQFGFTGDALDHATDRMVKYSEITGQDVVKATQGAKGIIEAYGLEYEDLDKILDDVAKASQDTGASTDYLMDSMQKYAPQIEALGIDTGEAAQLLGQMEQNGLDASTMLGGLAKAQADGAKDGKTLNEVLDEFKTFAANGATETEIMGKAVETFGTKRGPVMAKALQQGVLDFDALAESATDASGTVQTTFENTLDPIDQATIATNNLKIAGADLGTALQEGAAPIMEDFTEIIKDATKWFSELDDDQKELAIKFGTLAAASGPALSGIGGLAEKVGEFAQKAGEAKQNGESLTSVLNTGTKAGLVAAFVAVTGAIALYTIEASKADQETRDLVEASKEARESYDNQITSIGDNANIARGLASELQELSKQTNLTADDQARMKVLVDQLNQVVPDLNLQWDNQTQSLSLTGQELDNLIGKYEQTAKISALSEEQIRLEKERLEIKRQQTEQQGMLNEFVNIGFLKFNEETKLYETGFVPFLGNMDKVLNVRNTANELIQQSIDTEKQYQSIQSELGDALVASNEEVAASTEEKVEKESSAGKRLSAEYQRQAEDAKRRSEAEGQQQQDYLRRQKERADEAERIKNKETEAMQQYLKDLEESNTKWVALEQEAIETNKRNHEQYISDRNTEQRNQLTILQQLGDEQINLEEQNANKILEIKRKQLEAYSNYRNNLASLEGRISDEMMTELKNMGPEAAGLIAEFTNMSDAELQKHDAVWKESYQVTMDAAVDEIERPKKATAEMLAEQEGLIRDSRGILVEASKHSASGVPEGIKSQDSAVMTAASGLSNTAEKNLNFDGSTEGAQGAAKFGDGVASKKEYVRQQMEQVRKAAEAEAAKTNLESTGANIIAGLKRGIQSGQYGLTSTVSSVVGGIGKTTRKVMQIQSPSKVMRKLGGYVVDGVTIGLIDGKNDVASATHTMLSPLENAKPGIALEMVASAGQSSQGQSSERLIDSISEASSTAAVQVNMYNTIDSDYGSARAIRSLDRELARLGAEVGRGKGR